MMRRTSRWSKEMVAASEWRKCWQAVGLLLLLSCGASALLFGAITRVSADSPALTIEVAPNPIRLDRGGGIASSTPVTSSAARTATALVVIRNQSNLAARNLRLSCFSDDPVRTDPPCSSLESVADLAPNSNQTLTMRLAATDFETISGTLTLRLDYTLDSTGGPAGGQQVVLASIPIQTRDLSPVATNVTAQVQASDTPITSQLPGEVYVVVTNHASVPVDIGKPVARSESFITAIVQDPTGAAPNPTLLAPGSTQAFPVSIQVAADKAIPGAHVVGFDVPVTWTADGQPQSAVVSTSYQAQVQILGASEALSVLNIPSFILAPGFLFVSLWLLLLRFVYPRVAKDALPSIASPEFWVIAVMVSFVAALLYPIWTPLVLHQSRNYLTGYGLADVLWLWGATLALAAITYLLWIPAERTWGPSIRDQLKERAERRRTPLPGDNPIEVLRKLERQKLPLGLQRVLLQVAGSAPEEYFLAQPTTPAGPPTVEVAAIPQIVVKVKLGSQAVADPYGQELQSKLANLIRLDGEPGRLARLLDREGHRPRSWVEVGWSTDGGETTPFQVAVGQIQVRPDRLECAQLLALQESPGSPNGGPTTLIRWLKQLGSRK